MWSIYKSAAFYDLLLTFTYLKNNRCQSLVYENLSFICMFFLPTFSILSVSLNHYSHFVSKLQNIYMYLKIVREQKQETVIVVYENNHGDFHKFLKASILK